MQNQKISEHQVVARLKEAVLTLRKLPDVRVQGYFSIWPDVIYTQREIMRMDQKSKRSPATAESISQMEEAIEWLLWIEKAEDRKLVWMRAQNIPWEVISKTFGFSRVTANKKWKKAILKITNKYLITETAGH